MTNLVWNLKSFDQLSVPELYQILKARCDVFVVEQESPYPDLDDYDQKALHLWAEHDGEVYAYCRIFPQHIKYNENSIGRVLTTSKGRRSGLGKILLKFAIEIVENYYKTKSIRISAQDYLISFYSGFGFKETSKKYLEDGIPHTEMIRQE